MYYCDLTPKLLSMQHDKMGRLLLNFEPYYALPTRVVYLGRFCCV